MSTGTPANTEYAALETYYAAIFQDLGKLLRYATDFDSTKLPKPSLWKVLFKLIWQVIYEPNYFETIYLNHINS